MSVAAAGRVPESGRTIAGYYTLAGLYTLSAAAIWGVNTLFLLDAGLSFFEVFVANGAFSLGTVLFEIPTGVVADTLGRRMSFLLSVSVLGLSTLAYVTLAAIDAGVIAFALASVVMALGFTFTRARWRRGSSTRSPQRDIAVFSTRCSRAARR